MTMPEIRDPAIKLFGKTIALPANDGGAGEGEEDKGLPNKENTIPSKNREQESPSSEEKSEPVSSIADGNHKNSSSDEQDAEPENSPNRHEEEQNDSKNQQEKTLKKPDKILPCPRCNSLDTKFCYYNNYNVNQPRHFCKNCQRYWTAGGTMRNVPVGAGRRKNKNSLASHYRHLAVSDVSLLAIPDQMMNPSLRPNGTVLSFGPEAPLCDSMDSVLNLTEKATKSCHQKGLHRAEEQIMEEQSSMSSVTPSKCNDEGAGASVSERVIQNCQGFAPPVPYPNGSPWPFPWNPPPAICAPTYPMPFYPAAAYWGCTPWSLPWLQPLASPSPTSVSSGSGPSSPALGKHSREEGVLPWDSSSEKGDSTAKQSNQEGCRLWIPKTLRIHDPEEAAKSSVWATMGFKNDKTDGGGQGFFKGFQLTKGDPSRTYLGEASQALHANPAALSRSVSFQESS